ncbi:hypothetical protein [Rubritalea tangerina]|uniref:hypothetical protein n=1 Tax=Rubritalea tangerina TaxID=430798 RepID=UPI0036139D2F
MSLRKWLLLGAPFMRLRVFSDQLCSSAAHNVYTKITCPQITDLPHSYGRIPSCSLDLAAI